MLSSGILEVGKNIFAFKNDFLYSADVKPTVNKNRFDFIYWLHRAFSFYVYTMISMAQITILASLLAKPFVNRLIQRIKVVCPTFSTL